MARELFANPFARAIAGDERPTSAAGRVGLVVLRVVVVLLLVAAATVPFAILFGLFVDGARGNYAALGAGVATVVLTTLMGMGRAKPAADPAAPADSPPRSPR